MKEYHLEGGVEIDLSLLEADYIPLVTYTGIHRNMPVPCHDVIIKYGGGALLVERADDPFKGELMPVGGRIWRGVPTLDSLRDKVRKETGLELDDIIYLDWARTFAKTDPFSHGHGTDTINFMYFANGSGELKPDKTSRRAEIVDPNDYTEEFRQRLHPYARDFMDLAMPRIR